MRSILLLLLGLALSGCASVYVSDEGGKTLATVDNTCWYLFNTIPLASGNPDKPNRISLRLFDETVTLENNMKILESAMHEHHAIELLNLNSYTTDESILFFLLTRHACYTSAELVIPAPLKEPL